MSAEDVAGRAHGVIDLLFVGSRGDGPLRRALMGDVSAGGRGSRAYRSNWVGVPA